MLGLIRYTVELCPEVKGQLMLNGKPVANQLIQRGLTLEDKEIDEAGREHTLLKLLTKKKFFSKSIIITSSYTLTSY